MSSRIKTLADALKTALNAASFRESISAAVIWRPRFKVDDLDSLHVTVTPLTTGRAKARKRVTRIHRDGTVEMLVAVQQRIATAGGINETRLAELVELTEEIFDFADGGSDGRALALTIDGGDGKAECVNPTWPALYDLDQLDGNLCFSSAVILPFRELLDLED